MKNMINTVKVRNFAQVLVRTVRILLLVALSGCAAQPSVDDVEPRQTKGRIPTIGMSPWIASGKLAVRSARDNQNINFRWQRFNLDHEEIILSGPIGLGAVRITREEDTLWWIDEDQRRSITELALSQEGHTVLATLPFAVLGDWLLGITENTAPWRVEITRFQIQNGWHLPRTLSMYLSSGQSPAKVDLAVKAVVLKWQIETTTAPEILQAAP